MKEMQQDTAQIDAPQEAKTDVGLTEPPITDEDKKAKRLAVVEVFGPVIQGEGPLAGSKTMFVRFGGCDYRCTKCDSLHAVIPQAVKKNAQYLTAEEITDKLVALRGHSGTNWVTLSGGNPCMWDLTRLIQLLKGAKFAVAVETQGTLNPQWLTKCGMVVISPKSPGMGEKFEPDKFKNLLQMLWVHTVPVAVKIVVFSAQDLEFAVTVNEEINSINPPHWMGEMKYLSLGNPYPPSLDAGFNQVTPQNMQGDDLDPCPGKSHRDRLLDDYVLLIEEFCQDGRLDTWRFLPQLHVLMYSNEAGR
jgi:7-carboxy-7-deazaguanine synthase